MSGMPVSIRNRTWNHQRIISTRNLNSRIILVSILSIIDITSFGGFILPFCFLKNYILNLLIFLIKHNTNALKDK